MNDVGRNHSPPSWHEVEFGPGEISLFINRDNPEIGMSTLDAVSERLKRLLPAYHRRKPVTPEQIHITSLTLKGGDSKYWGIMAEVEYEIPSRSGWYRHVFHLVFSDGGLSAKFFTQRRRHYNAK